MINSVELRSLHKILKFSYFDDKINELEKKHENKLHYVNESYLFCACCLLLRFNIN